MVKILGMRHGQKDGDKLTPFGAQQIFAAGEALLDQDWKFDRLVHSGAKRTKQSLYVLAAAMELFNLPLEENKGFHYSTGLHFHTSPGQFRAEMEKIQQANGTLTAALELSEYARFFREQISRTLLELAKDMEAKGQQAAVVISHSPIIVTASPYPDITPYGLFECDGILYTINDGFFSDLMIIRAPLKGGTIW